MEAISDLPMLHDIDADYSPQYVKLARIIRGKIESGDLGHLAPLPAASLADEYGVSVGVARVAAGDARRQPLRHPDRHLRALPRQLASRAVGEADHSPAVHRLPEHLRLSHNGCLLSFCSLWDTSTCL